MPKIFEMPEGMEWNPDYSGKWDAKAWHMAETYHKESLKAHLVTMGYTGKNTGRIYSTPHADGYANYMVAETGRKFYLIHLPYGDGWHAPDVQYIPKREILARIEQQENMASIFDR